PYPSLAAAAAHVLAGDSIAAGAALDAAASAPALAAEAAYVRAVSLSWQGREPEARLALSAASSGPLRALARALRGQPDWNQGDYLAAWKAWEGLTATRRAAWRLDRPHAAAALLAGGAELAAGRPTEALALLRQAREGGIRHERLSAWEATA